MQVAAPKPLVRARHPTSALSNPADLLPASGDPLYQPLSAFVIRQAVGTGTGSRHQGCPSARGQHSASVLNAPDCHHHRCDNRFRPIRVFPGSSSEVTEDEIIRRSEWARELATQLKLLQCGNLHRRFGSGMRRCRVCRPAVHGSEDRPVRSCRSARQTGSAESVQTVVDRRTASARRVCRGVETNRRLAVPAGDGMRHRPRLPVARPMRPTNSSRRYWAEPRAWPAPRSKNRPPPKTPRPARSA